MCITVSRCYAQADACSARSIIVWAMVHPTFLEEPSSMGLVLRLVRGTVQLGLYYVIMSCLVMKSVPTLASITCTMLHPVYAGFFCC